MFLIHHMISHFLVLSLGQLSPRVHDNPFNRCFESPLYENVLTGWHGGE